MIRYAKGAAPPRIAEIASTPGIEWDALGAVDRDPIRDALVRDQGALCAYCQRRIIAAEDPESGRPRMKIEHWYPRSAQDSRPLVWSNLLGVCTGLSQYPDDRGRVLPTCDTSRGNRKLFLHPVVGQGPDPRAHLRYAKNGKLEPHAESPRVVEDIDALNLNAPSLVRSRAAVLDAAWDKLKRANFAAAAVRRLAKLQEIVPGSSAPEHAEFLRYHLEKKLRQLGA